MTKLTDAELEDFSVLSAFLAMAVKQKLVLNELPAQEAWDAYTRVLGMTPEDGAEMLREIQEDVGA